MSLSKEQLETKILSMRSFAERVLIGVGYSNTVKNEAVKQIKGADDLLEYIRTNKE